jgi:hypothetical protein
MGFIKSWGREIKEHGGHGWSLPAERGAFLFQILLKFMLIHGKGGTRWFPSSNQQVGRGTDGSQPGEGGS